MSPTRRRDWILVWLIGVVVVGTLAGFAGFKRAEAKAAGRQRRLQTTVDTQSAILANQAEALRGFAEDLRTTQQILGGQVTETAQLTAVADAILALAQHSDALAQQVVASTRCLTDPRRRKSCPGIVVTPLTVTVTASPAPAPSPSRSPKPGPSPTPPPGCLVLIFCTTSKS